MMKRQQRIEWIRSVEREYQAASAALELLFKELRADPSYGNRFGWRLRDAVNLRTSLEAAFFVRLFAEFESGLRDVWRRYFRRRSHPPMRDLLLSVATIQSVPQAGFDQADEVRLYRNGLVHEESAAGAVSIPEARRRLCRFFSRLPPDW